MRIARNPEMALATGIAPKAQPEPGLCIHQVFERQAQKTPHAVAVNCADEKLTYAQLNDRANHLAAHLKNLGVGPEIPVTLYLERSLDMVVAILGVLKAGGAYVPVDLAYPKDRFSFMLQDTQAPILLTQKKLLDAIPETKVQILCVEDLFHVSRFMHLSSIASATEDHESRLAPHSDPRPS